MHTYITLDFRPTRVCNNQRSKMGNVHGVPTRDELFKDKVKHFIDMEGNMPAKETLNEIRNEARTDHQKLYKQALEDKRMEKTAKYCAPIIARVDKMITTDTKLYS